MVLQKAVNLSSFAWVNSMHNLLNLIIVFTEYLANEDVNKIITERCDESHNSPTGFFRKKGHLGLRVICPEFS